MKISINYKLAIFLFCAAAAQSVLFPQETINNGSVSGRVTDVSGAVIQGAQVLARQTETNQASTAVTDHEGRFRFPYLKLGPYEITFHAAGFSDIRRPVTLTVGSAFELPVTLAVASLGTEVTVSGEATVLEASPWSAV